MQRYESYMTRRAPVNTTGMQPTVAARARLDALRDIMRMEMPDAKSDITNGPITFSWGSVPEPPLHKIYAANPPTATLDGAQCLYLIVSLGNPEAMEQFNPSEIGMVFDSATNTSKPCFIDGWGKPIMWLRWAPGFNSPYSALQVADATKNHDPFDPRGVDGFAYHLIPLIYSCGGRTKSDGTPQYGIDLQAGYVFAGNPYANLNLGAPISGEGAEGNITNHYIEQR